MVLPGSSIAEEYSPLWVASFSCAVNIHVLSAVTKFALFINILQWQHNSNKTKSSSLSDVKKLCRDLSFPYLLYFVTCIYMFQYVLYMYLLKWSPFCINCQSINYNLNELILIIIFLQVIAQLISSPLYLSSSCNDIWFYTSDIFLVVIIYCSSFHIWKETNFLQSFNQIE